MTEHEAAENFLDGLETSLADIEKRIGDAETARDAEFDRATEFIAERAAELADIDHAMQTAFAAARGRIDSLQEAAQALMEAATALRQDVEESVGEDTAALASLDDEARKSSASTLVQFNDALDHLDGASDALESEVEKLQSAHTQDLQRMTTNETSAGQAFAQLRQALQAELALMERGLSEGQERAVRVSVDAAQAASRAQADHLSALTQKATGSLAALRGGLDQGMNVLGQIRAAGSSLSGAVSGDARAAMQEISSVMQLIAQIRPVLELAKTLT